MAGHLWGMGSYCNKYYLLSIISHTVCRNIPIPVVFDILWLVLPFLLSSLNIYGSVKCNGAILYALNVHVQANQVIFWHGLLKNTLIFHFFCSEHLWWI